MNTYNLSEEKIRYFLNNNEKVKDIAKFYKCSTSLIYVFCKKNKIDIPKLNLVGYKYHWLEIVARSKSRDGQVYWICKCECGKEIELSTKTITRDERKSCGCWMKSREYSRCNYLWSGFEEIHGKWWGNVRRGAKQRGHEFNLSIEEAWNLFKKQSGKCALSGVDLKFCKSIREVKDTTASLDRIDSSKGYTIDNVQWVHKTVNLMKQGIDMNEFKWWIKMIGENLEI